MAECISQDLDLPVNNRKSQITVVYMRWKFIPLSCPSPESRGPGLVWWFGSTDSGGVASWAGSSRRL